MMNEEILVTKIQEFFHECTPEINKLLGSIKEVLGEFPVASNFTNSLISLTSNLGDLANVLKHESMIRQRLLELEVECRLSQQSPGEVTEEKEENESSDFCIGKLRNPYGFCPVCKANNQLTPGVYRDNTLLGFHRDTCSIGHTYPSYSAVEKFVPENETKESKDE